MSKKSKVLVVSIDHLYGFGWRALSLINALKQELIAQGATVLEHSIPDLPRALLQGADFLVKYPLVGERFWFDFYRELIAKAKVCDNIREEINATQKKEGATVIFCKNFNGTAVHAAMHLRNFYDSGMDALDLGACCGIDLNQVRPPIRPDVNIFLKIDPEVAYQTYCRSFAEILERLEGTSAQDKVKKLFGRLDFFHQQPVYLAEFDRLGEKGFIIDAGKDDEQMLTEMMEIIVKCLKM